MRTATCAMLLGASLLAALAGAGLAEIPQGMIAIVEAKDIDGLALVEGAIDETWQESFAVDDAGYSIDRKALASLEGVDALLLIHHRSDVTARGGILHKNWQEVLPIRGGAFEVEGVPELVLNYELLMSGDQLVLAGGGNQILCPEGERGPYHIWKVEKLRLVDREDVKIH